MSEFEKRFPKSKERGAKITMLMWAVDEIKRNVWLDALKWVQSYGYNLGALLKVEKEIEELENDKNFTD